MIIYNVEQSKILASNLGVKPAFLYLCLELSRDNGNYRIIKLPKKDGTFRTIVEPPKGIKIIQRKIVEYLKRFQKEKYCAYGFVKGKNNVGNANLHINKKFIFKTDLKDYFTSIQSGRIYKMFLSEPFLFCKSDATILTNLLCFNNTLAQGFPSSPYVSNIVTRRLDNALIALSQKYKCNYSRYADDITFSTNSIAFPVQYNKFFSDLKEIITKEMFVINDKKTQLLSSKTRQIVTGIVVNEKLNLKRSYYRQLRQILYTWEKDGITICSKKNNMSEDKLKRYVLGKLAYYKSVVGQGNACYLRLCNSYNTAINSEFFKVPINYKLNTAKHILKSGNIKPAGNSAADVLEEFLQSLCFKNGITNVVFNKKSTSVKDLPIDPLKNELKTKGVINSVQAKEIDKLNAIRILCNHKKQTNPSRKNIEDLIDGTEKLILELS